MIGLGVFFVAAIWFAISFSVMFFSTMKIKKIMWRLLLICIFWPLIFLAPMADVIIGLYQFDQVCKEKGWVYDEHEVRNSTVKYGGQTVQRIDDKFIPIEKITTYWVDLVKEETMFSVIEFRVGSGWLVRSLFKIPKYPTKSTRCYPDEYLNGFFKRLNVTEVEDKK